MKLQVIPWAILAMSAASLVLGCVEWLNGRGQKLAMAGVPTIALAVSMLLGDEHPVWRSVCLAVVFVFATFTFVTLRKAIRWRSLTTLSAASAILLTIITELATDVVGGVPTAVVIALLCAIAASTALFIGSMLWEVQRLTRASRRTA